MANALVNNARIRGFSTDTLDSLVYRGFSNDDNCDHDLVNNLNCSYILPKHITHVRDTLSVMSFNIRSMQTNFDNFAAELLDSNRRCDVIGLCETHLTDSTANLYTSELEDYQLFTTNVLSNKGGVCMFVRNKFNCKVRNDLSIKRNDLETLFIQIIIDNKPFLIGMMYRRPGTSPDAFLTDLSRILNQINHKCILMGDLNLNLLNELNCMDVHNLTNRFRQFSFIPMIIKPTRVFNNSATLIDHIWINFNQMSYTSSIVFTDISDHFPTIFYCDSRIDDSKRTISYRKSGEYFDNLFSERLHNFDFDTVLNTADVHEAFKLFNEAIVKIYEDSYPLTNKIIRENDNKAWLTSAIRQSIKTKNRLYKKYIKKPISYGRAYKDYRNALTKVIKNSKNKYFLEKFENSKGNVKKTWENINKILGKSKSNQNRVFKLNGRYTDDPKIISNTFNEYFANIATTVTNELEDPTTSFADYLPPQLHPEILWEPTTMHEVKRLVMKMNDTKGGPDGLPIVIIKKNIDYLSPIISALCNKSMRAGVFPNIHKVGQIIPIYKNKDIDDIGNYRPICLLNTIAKIIEKVVATRILSHMENNFLLSNSQYAYRKGRGTDISTTKFISDI